MFGKKNYPYVTVTPLAVRLWNFFLPRANVILFLIYDQDNESKDRMKKYQDHLDGLDVAYSWIPAGDMDCPTKSQIVRMWAFKVSTTSIEVIKDNHNLNSSQDSRINRDDVVVTVDANAFVMTPDVLKPIYDNPYPYIWVYHYEFSAADQEGIGGTFNENFIAAYADVWELIVDPGSSPCVDKAWMERKVNEIGLRDVKKNNK